MALARRESDVLYKQLSVRLRDALVDGSVKAAEQIADQALAVGQDPVAVEALVIAPAMWMIGELWERDVISVADEHLATAISHGIVARLFRHMLRSAAGSGARVMLAAPQGEHHILGLRMAADVLEGAGYEVMYLGADVPLGALLQACSRHRPAVLGLTLSMSLSVPTLLWEIQEIAKLKRAPAVMLGGRALRPAITPGLAAPVVADIEQVVEVVAALIANPPTAPALAPTLAARTPPHEPSARIASDAIGTIPEAFSTTALAAADAVREVARHARAMEQLAHKDALTGLWNRRTCDDRLLALTEDDSQDAILMLDVDNFKAINDSDGHEAGDAALVRIATTIQTTIRAIDFAARFGGDEFMILLPSTTIPRALEVAERIRATIQQELRVPPVTVSIGVAEVSGSSLTSRLAADRALYVAKAAGRNQIAATQE